MIKMDNLDAIAEEKAKLAGELGEAITGEDEKKIEMALVAFASHIEKCVLAEHEGLISARDTSILAGRGVQQLTAEETSYYSKAIKAMKSGNPKMELQNLDVALPETVLNRVFEDLTVAHPLLDAISFTNTTALTEWLYNAHETQLAKWGKLCADIIKEITSGFKTLNMTLYKLSAFVPVCNAMLDLGPACLDRYVRVILAEAIALALEEAIICGTGNEQPIGMNRDV